MRRLTVCYRWHMTTTRPPLTFTALRAAEVTLAQIQASNPTLSLREQADKARHMLRRMIETGHFVIVG